MKNAIIKRLTIGVLLSLSLPIEANEMIYYIFSGKMGEKVPVEICFERFSNRTEKTVAGYIHYTQSLQPILIVGYVNDDNWFYLNEFLPDGTISGRISMKIVEGKGANVPVIAEGEWTNPKTGVSYSLTTLTSPYNLSKTKMYLPQWFDYPLQYESPDRIGHEYSFNLWSDREDTGKYGTASFAAAGKNKIHFDITKVNRHKIAEGYSDKTRPAVLNGSSFTYTNVNDCDYGFKATFFKKFVVLETLSDSEGSNCLGAGASFDGIYIKVKQ